MRWAPCFRPLVVTRLVQLLGAEGQFAAKAKLGAELEKIEETFLSIYGFNCDSFFLTNPQELSESQLVHALEKVHQL